MNNPAITISKFIVDIQRLAVLALVVVEECLCVDKHGHDDISLLALDEIVEGNGHGQFRLGHVEDLVLDVLHVEAAFLHGLQLLDNGAEKHVDDEGINSALVVDIQHSPEVLDCFWSLFVVHCQHELQKALVVHLAVDRRVFFEDPVDDDRGKPLRVLGQVFLLEIAVFVGVELVEPIVESSGELDGEPILPKILFGVSFLSEFVKFSKDGGSKHVLDVNPPSPFGVKEEEKLPGGCKDVLILEPFVHVLEVHKGRDEFRDVLTEVGLSQVAISRSIVQTYMDSRLEEVVFSDDGVEEGLHVDSAVLVTVELKEG